MQSVPAPAWGLSRRHAAALAVAALALAFAVAIALGVGDERVPAHTSHVVGPPGVALINGNALQSADCTDWNTGTADGRAAILAALRRSVGGASGYGPGSTLTDSDANALFTRACTQAPAQHWLLYELYIRAAGFKSYAPGASPHE